MSSYAVSSGYLAKSGEGRRSLSTDESRRNTFKPLSVRGGAATATALVTPSLQFVPVSIEMFEGLKLKEIQI